MKYVKWIFVVLLICSLTAFVEKDKPTGGLSEGDVAPDFKIESTSEEQPAFKLGNLKGKYVLLSFWASYDAQSRMQNGISTASVKMTMLFFTPKEEELLRLARLLQTRQRKWLMKNIIVSE